MLWILLLLLLFGIVGIRHPWKWFKDTRMKNQRSLDEGTQHDDSEQEATVDKGNFRRWLGDSVILRALFAAVIFRASEGGLTAMFVELAKTNDFVLEYRYWIMVGIYLACVLLAVIAFMASRPRDSTPQKESAGSR